MVTLFVLHHLSHDGYGGIALASVTLFLGLDDDRLHDRFFSEEGDAT